MGRTHPTITLRVREFEQRWSHLAHAPRAVDREAFAQLCAFTHYQAAAISYAATPYLFETMLVAMLIGVNRRAQELDKGAATEAEKTAAEEVCSLQESSGAILTLLGQRIIEPEREWQPFVRALRQEDQDTFLSLWALPRRLPLASAPPLSDAYLLEMMIALARQLARLERYQIGSVPVIDADPEKTLCGI